MRSLIAATATLIVATAAQPAAAADRDQVQQFFDCAYMPSARIEGTLMDAAMEMPALRLLAEAVIAAGLTDTLSGDERYTLYAPTNEAFARLDGGELDRLLADVDDNGNVVGLRDLLSRHIADGSGFVNDPRRVFANAAAVPSVAGSLIEFHREEAGTAINDAQLASCQPLETDNGTVYLVDRVFIADAATPRG